jgi:hypothetical protein
VSLTDRSKALEAEARKHAGARRLARAFDDPARAQALKEGIVALRERLLADQE